MVSPPYDVLDADTVRDLESANRRNIVRLILSRRFERPYLAVRRRLEQWRDKAYLRADDEPALYLYQYTVDQVTVRGLIGVVALREESERVILPHEDVMQGPVEDRTVLMRTTETNLEPILLVHEGSAGLRAELSEIAGGSPLADFTALDGSRHQLWALTDRTAQQRVAEEVHDTQTLIADGHHRYAAYLNLQQEMRSTPLTSAARAGQGVGQESPWDYGLAMLVDQHDYPLTIGPIHRSVSAVTMSDVVDLASEHGDTVTTYPDREAAFAAQAGRERMSGREGGREPGRGPGRETAAFVLSDGRAWAVLETPRTQQVDAAVLHESVFQAWQVAEDQVGYHHSLDQALSTTSRQPGIVVAVQPPSVSEVMAAAARGQRMPRKSTSFGPKPRMGVVMRDLRDQ